MSPYDTFSLLRSLPEEPSALTTRALAAKFGVTVRTVQRDLVALAGSGLVSQCALCGRGGS